MVNADIEAGASIEVDITNTGTREGCELVQIYVRPLAPKIDRPEKELRAFAKLRLKAGETQTAKLKMSLRDLAYFDVKTKGFRVDAGHYELVVAANATDIRSVVPLNIKQDWQE